MISKMKSDKNIIIGSAVLVFCFFGLCVYMGMANDTYDVFQHADSWKYMLFENGRIIDTIVYFICEKINLSDFIIYELSMISGLLFLFLAVYIYAKEIIVFTIGSWKSAVFLAFITISNVFIIEYFQFVETGFFMLAILLNVIAFKWINLFLNNKRKIQYFLGTLLMLIIAVNIYQISVGLFVILCLPFVYKKSNCIKTFFINNFIVFGLYGITLLFSYIMTSFVLHSSRVSEGNLVQIILGRLSSLWSKWIQTLLLSKTVLNKFSLLPFLLIVLVSGILLVCLSSKNIKGVIIDMGGYAYILLGTMFIGLLPWLCNMAECVSYRTVYPCGAIIGVLLSYLIMNISEVKQPISFKGLSYILLIFMFFILSFPLVAV